MRKKKPKYAPIGDYLAKLPKAKREVSLNFAEIEEIIGAGLPQSASRYRQWWANQQGGSRAPYWRAAGFLVAAVDLSRKLVEFERRKAAREGKAPTPQKVTPKEAERQAQPQAVLIQTGFSKVGNWVRDGNNINLDCDIPQKPAVYAHIVDGNKYYIGHASVGLRGRLRFYARPSTSQRTSFRINGLINKKLCQGHKVWVIAAFPKASEWKGLPVDTVVGLEGGLIRSIRPPWNKRGISTNE